MAAITAFTVVSAGSANACSFRWEKGYSPEEIRQRDDLRKVKGVFRLEEISGERYINEDGEEWIRDAQFVGRLETQRGTGWQTIHDAPDHTTTCYVGTYFKPEGDASGTFYLSRTKVDGRYEILLWDGEYLPAKSEADKTESES